MALNLRLTLGRAPAASIVPLRLELVDAMSETFELTLRFRSPDAALDLEAITGDTAEVFLDDEPLVKRVAGVVRQARQLTTEPTGLSEYELVIVPALWLTTRREDCRIFQDLDVRQIVGAVVAGYDGRVEVPAARLVEPHSVRAYTVQFAETDFAFLTRILAEEGISWFFDHANGGTWTLVDDTSLLSPPEVPPAIPFIEEADLGPGREREAQVRALEVRVGVATSALAVRSYNLENPQLELDARVGAASSELVTREGNLERYEYDGPAFRSAAAGQTLATRRLEALRSRRRVLACNTTFTVGAGSRFTLFGHPREGVDGALLVERCTMVVSSSSDSLVARHEVLCVSAATRRRPPRLPKPRVAGTHVAFVTGAPGEEIDVDALGRIEVEFRWDRRDRHAGGTSRRVQVSQPWAGAGFGFTLLPRVGDEVVVAYVDGDLDEPIVVGRVHNGRSAHPIALPQQKTQSVWRSRSTPGGDGFNQILMEDAAGRERLELHAHRDFRAETGRNSDTTVGLDHKITVGGSSTTRVSGGQSTSAGSVSTSTGPYKVSATTVSILASETMALAASDVRRDTSTNHFIDTGGLWVKARSIVQMIAGKILAQGNAEVKLVSGRSSITLTPGGIQIQSGGEVTINGSVIKLNC
ncbi:MAG: type VI secretion system tip protein TssI/VgrG [Polyangiaceae bacterium]